MGYGGLLIPLVSVVVALTLLPVVLATIGPVADARRLRRTDRAERHWAAWARLVIRHRAAAALDEHGRARRALHRRAGHAARHP
jgi:RND superfamily putative drug exporter